MHGCCAAQSEVLDIGPERIGAGAEDCIHAGIGGLHHHVASLIDVIRIVASAANEAISAETTIEVVVGTVAGEDVIQVVAGAVNGSAARQDKVFQPCPKPIGDGATHGIRAVEAFLNDGIAVVIDRIGVI